MDSHPGLAGIQAGLAGSQAGSEGKRLGQGEIQAADRVDIQLEEQVGIRLEVGDIQQVEERSQLGPGDIRPEGLGPGDIQELGPDSWDCKAELHELAEALDRGKTYLNELRIGGSGCG